MIPHRSIILSLLLISMPSAGYASPTEEKADAELCAEELATAQPTPEGSAEDNAPKRRKRNVWNPYGGGSDAVGDNFSRYSGADEYDSGGVTVAPDEPQAKRGGGSKPAPKASRSGGSRLRRG